MLCTTRSGLLSAGIEALSSESEIHFDSLTRSHPAHACRSALFDSRVPHRADLKTVGVLRGHESRVFKATFSPIDDTLLATCSEDATCRIWDVAKCKQLFCLKGHEEAIYSVKFSPDGKHILSAGSDGKIVIWDLGCLTVGAPASLAMCAAVQTITVGGDAFAAQFLDGKTIASAIDDRVVLWDIETGKPKASKTLVAATDYVFGGLQRNPDATPWVFCMHHHQASGVMALGVSDASIRLLDSNLNEQVVMRGHARDVTCLNFREDGAELLSGSGDHMAGIWDLSTLQIRQVLKGHEAPVHDVCYWPSSSCEEVCTVSMDRTLKVWQADTGECSATVGPDVTAKLCLAPNKTLAGVAVAGGENKTHTGNDFRVSLLAKDATGFERLQAAPTVREYLGQGSAGWGGDTVPGLGGLAGAGGRVDGYGGLSKTKGARGKRAQE